jgi:hypothetical protein
MNSNVLERNEINYLCNEYMVCFFVRHELNICVLLIIYAARFNPLKDKM